MDPTFVARLTARLPSAIATIAVSGPLAIAAVRGQAKLASSNFERDRVYYGHWALGGLAANTVEQIVLCRTDEQSLEIHCHGGQAICDQILQDLQRAGCTLVTAPFGQAHWNIAQGCPIATAAAQDLLLATTDRAAAILVDQLAGALTREVRGVLLSISQADTSTARRELETLLCRSQVGLHVVNPWRIVLAGPPNVGKSSLINALAGWQQSIVHAEPGTTRDWTEAQCAIHGWPVCLSDTAGLRDATDPVETAGVERARRQIQEADVLLIVVDAAQGWTETHQDLLTQSQANSMPALIVWNKIDLEGRLPAPADLQPIPTSSLGSPGIEALLQAIAEIIAPEPAPSVNGPAVAVPFRPQQVEYLRAAHAALARHETVQATMSLQALVARAAGAEHIHHQR